MERYLMWRGGKDSTASLILCHENGIQLDGIIFSEVMFDNGRNISAENPTFIKWIYETAIPKIKEMGYNVIVVRADKDYLHYFHKEYKHSRNHENGKKYGFPMSGRCYVNDRLKVKPMEQIKKQLRKNGQIEEIVGIAYDEPKRLESAYKRGQRSVLAEFAVCERDTYDICKRYGLLNPLYDDRSRGGCWFCPNASIKEFSALRRQHPQLWQELVNLSKTENLATYGFKFSKTVQQVEAEIDQYEQNLNIGQNQMTIFE